jgi:hypothetical protein
MPLATYKVLSELPRASAFGESPIKVFTPGLSFTETESITLSLAVPIIVTLSLLPLAT